MVVKVKESFEKTRQVKKFVLRGDKNTRFVKKYYQIKRNFNFL